MTMKIMKTQKRRPTKKTVKTLKTKQAVFDAKIDRLGKLYRQAQMAVFFSDRSTYIDTMAAIYTLECDVKRYSGEGVPRMSTWHELLKNYLSPAQKATADSLVCPMELYQCRRNDAAYAEARSLVG